MAKITKKGSIMSKRKMILKSSSAFALLASGLVLSQPAGAQEVAAEEGKLVSDTIIVTATRRNETVQDVPLNIAALGEAQIEEQGLAELSDVLAYVPGINIVDRGGRQGNPIIVRGLNADPIGSGDGNNDGGGTVATYLGEIPLFVDLKLNDMQRVEVLLGPQGTLYGAGTLGGAIRYIPNRPDFDDEFLSVRADAYQYSEADSLSHDVGFTFNMPIASNFAVRGSLDVSNDSGYMDAPFIVQTIGVSNPDPDFSDPADVAANLNPQTDVNSEETISGRLAARWQPVEWLDANLTYYYQEADIGGRSTSAARSTVVPAGKYDVASRVEEPNTITNELFALEVTADLGFAELTSATGKSKFADDGQRDQTNLLISLEYSYETFPTFTAFTHEVGETDTFNQEIRLVSQTDGPLNWIVGGFYNKQDAYAFSAEFTPGYADFAGFDRSDNLEYFSQSRIELVESAFFGEIGYDLTERLSVTVGGRYYDYELKSFSAVDFPLFDPDFVAPTIDQIGNTATELSQADDGFLYKFNISYDINDDIMIYGTVSEGYRIGDSNGIGQCDVYDPEASQGACALAPGQQFGPNPDDVALFDEREYGPDQTTNYELGMKSEWLDGDLTLNAALYFVEWSDPQLSSATVNANIPITINAEGAESLGTELSGDWRVTDAFRIRGSYSYTQSELTSDVPSLIRTITPPGFGSAFEDGKAGDRLPGSPEHQFSVFGSYGVELSGGRDIAFNLGYAWQSDVLTRTGARGSSLTLDSFGVANASAVYDAGPWTATLYVNNLLDEYVETGAVSTSLSNQIVLGSSVRSFGTHIAPPRAIGIRFKWDIG